MYSQAFHATLWPPGWVWGRPREAAPCAPGTPVSPQDTLGGSLDLISRIFGGFWISLFNLWPGRVPGGMACLRLPLILSLSFSLLLWALLPGGPSPFVVGLLWPLAFLLACFFPFRLAPRGYVMNGSGGLWGGALNRLWKAWQAPSRSPLSPKSNWGKGKRFGSGLLFFGIFGTLLAHSLSREFGNIQGPIFSQTL